MNAAMRDRYHRSWMGQRTGVTNGMMVLVMTAVAVLCIAVPYLYYANAQRAADEAKRDNAVAEYNTTVATYQAARASWENARDEVTRCEQRVESSAKLSSALEAVNSTFDGLVDIVEEAPGAAANPRVVRARDLVNVLGEIVATYQPVDPSECPPDPGPPPSPPLLPIFPPPATTTGG